MATMINAAKKPSKVVADVREDAIDWESERLVEVKRSEKRAWIVAATGWFLAVIACVAILGLTPLKEVRPFVVRVNSTTGVANVVTGLKAGPESYDQAVTRYFAAQYIYAREGYSRKLAPIYYERVGLMSNKDVSHRYAQMFSPTNDKSPLNIYGERATVQAHIVSISFLTNDLVSVRFTKDVEYKHQPSTTSHWIATIRFTYTSAPMHQADRLVNPLGFQVVEYRVAPEVIGETKS